MKELYISPELQVMSFVPAEELAQQIPEGGTSFGDLLAAAGRATSEPGASNHGDDLTLPIIKQ